MPLEVNLSVCANKLDVPRLRVYKYFRLKLNATVIFPQQYSQRLLISYAAIKDKYVTGKTPFTHLNTPVVHSKSI